MRQSIQQRGKLLFLDSIMFSTRQKLFFCAFGFLLIIAGVFLFIRNPFANALKSGSDKTPGLILWAWERPENFNFIDTKETGVAFLSQTIAIKNDDVERFPRRQPLEIPEGVFVIAVTRIESDKKEKPVLTNDQREKIVELIAKTSSQKNVKAIQIDFDASETEREFYKTLLVDLRKQLPVQISLSITALASWCIYDNWIKGAPVDEVVPMLFRLGVDEQNIVGYLNSNNDWREPLCRGSYGISLDEPERKIDSSRRIYVFNPRSWSREDLLKLKDKVSR